MKINNEIKLEQNRRYKKIANYFKENKYDKVIRKATEYLEINPRNVQVRFMRARSYRELGLFEEALTDLLYNIKIDNNAYSITELYYLYYHLNMYKEALELLPTMYELDTINKYSLALTELVMKTSMGIDMKFTEDRDEYIKNQIRNYDEEKTFEHLKHHTVLNGKKSVFANNINLNYLYEIIKENINNSQKANVKEILEVHYFLIRNIGKTNYGYNCDYIKVIVIPNTNKIISMYPVEQSKGSKDNILICDYDKLFNREQKVKTNSRIDQFNKRYNR